jgi:hypothetical protein
MEASFGPKREIWHTLDLAAHAEALAAHETTAATRKVSEEELAKLPEDLAAMRPRRARRRGPMAAALVSLLVLLVGGGALAWRHRSALDPPPRPAAESGGGPVLVVAENGNVAIEQGSTPPAVGASTTAAVSAAPGLVAAPEPVPASSRATTRTHARAARSGRASAGPDPLSSAVANRAPDIRRCFTELGGEIGQASEAALRFEVGVDGAVKSLAVLPPAIGATPLGACLAKVGRGISFAPQPAPITFRIPLTVQMRRQERER